MQPDLNKMMQEIAKAQQSMMRVQQELSQETVEGVAGGGVVVVTCSGAMEFKGVKIKPEAVDPNDVGMLEDLLLVAIKDACSKAIQLGEKKMKPTLGNMKTPPGLNL
ncbi:MAG TPA: YbaB/EbfC family nucleoid-associated protein [Drouetiella sp.]